MHSFEVLRHGDRPQADGGPGHGGDGVRLRVRPLASGADFDVRKGALRLSPLSTQAGPWGARSASAPVEAGWGACTFSAMTELPGELRDVVRQIVARLEPGERTRLLQDLDIATVERGNPAGSILEFRLPGYRALPRSGQRPLLVEARVRDADGEMLDVVLFVDPNGHLYELELIRWADGDVIGPDWRTFAIKA